MDKTIACTVGVLSLILFTNVSTAQPPSDRSLILSTGCGRFSLVLGRLKLDNFHYKKVRLHQSRDPETDDEEFVCVTARAGTPSLHYLRSRGHTRITIDTMDTDAVRIESRTSHPSDVMESLLVEQPRKGPIRVESRLGSREELIEAVSFWHLMAEAPIVFENQIEPILQLIIEQFDASRMASAVNERLQVTVTRSPPIAEQEFGTWMKQLGSPRRSQRAAAHRRLASAGVGVLSMLTEIDPSTLDAEQQRRVSQLVKSLSIARRDTPDRVAAWLATDQNYLIAASRDWSPQQQAGADRYLIAMFGEGSGASRVGIASRPTTDRR